MTIAQFLLIMALSLAGFVRCATETVQENPEATDIFKDQDDASPKASESIKDIDLRDLESELRMERPHTQLGLRERRFTPCRSKAYPSSSCEPQILSTLYFQLLCRDSEGTVENVTNAELMPVVAYQLRWKVGLYSGISNTDNEGFGQVLFVASGTSAGQSLMLIINENALRLSVKDVKRIIVPREWCE